MDTEIIWTVLPNGRVNGKARATLFVAPQLSGGATLSEFALFHNWPRTLVDDNGNWKITIKLLFSNPGIQIESLPLAETAKTGQPRLPDHRLWSSIFPPETTVNSFKVEDLSQRRINSFPATNIKALVDKSYRTFAAASPTRLPRKTGLLNSKNLRLNDISVVPRTRVSVDGQPTVFARKGERRNYAKMAKEQSGRLGRTVTREDLRLSELRDQIDGEIERQFTDPNLGVLKAIPPRPANAREDFMQLKKFTIPRRSRPLEDKVQAIRMDFHQMVTAYSQYPALMRRLGLAIDIVLLEDPPAGNGFVRVTIDPEELQTKAPKTRYSFNPGAVDCLSFSVAVEKDSDLQNRCLQLDKSEYSLEHLDIAGAGSKVMDLADKLSQETVSRSSDTDERAPLPALQTAGISLVRTGRAHMYHTYFTKQQTKLQPYFSQKKLSTSSGQADIKEKSKVMARTRMADEEQAAELWADDLTRGYRIDVFDGTSSQWRSLCRRKTIFMYADGSGSWEETGEINDGWVSLAVTQSRDGDDDDLYIHESLFRWSGWSLVAPRPGKTLSSDYKSVEQTSKPAQDLNLAIQAEALKGSLPRLRFGASYKIRARAVDLAGNSLSLAEANDLTSEDRNSSLVTAGNYTYRRYEPVAQPVVLARNALNKSSGESIERLVIRSYNSNPSLDGAGSKEKSQRHIAPTGTAQLLAEFHGKFDNDKGQPRADLYNTIISHDNPLPNKDSVYNQPAVPLTYLPDPAATGAAFANLPTDGTLDNSVIVQSGDGITETWNIEPPSATIRHVHQISFGRESLWPDLKTFRFVISGCLKPKNPEWDPAGRELNVFLLPGETRKVRLSSYISENDLDKFELWNSMKKDGNVGQLRSRVLAGVHWMITPYREITLVHAVQQPLVIPDFNSLASFRNRDEGWTTLADTFPVDGKSTGRIDVHGSWREIDDRGAGPRRIDARGHAFEISVKYEDSEVSFGPDGTKSFTQVNPKRLGVVDKSGSYALSKSDGSKDINVNLKDLRGAGTTQKEKSSRGSAVKSKSIFSAQRQDKATELQRPDLGADKGILKRQTIRRPIGRHNFGDTRYRRVTYVASATTRYLEYLSFYRDYKIFQENYFAGGERTKRQGDIVDQWTRKYPEKSFIRKSRPVTVDVLSSSRPPAPEVEYILPTFGWERNRAKKKVTSKRVGGGLRIYLKRPWFASGEGELLGVVLDQPGRSRLTGRQLETDMNLKKPYVTQWGMDPIWRSAPTPRPWTPGVENFRNVHKTETDLTLEELPDSSVAVAGYIVGEWDSNNNLTGFDEDRQLWFCDIEIDPGQSYFPFIRLALARYQPNSISWKGLKPGDVKLSRVILADFAQLAPDRFASVTLQSGNILKVMVTGPTFVESGVDVYGPPELNVQRQDVGSKGETIQPGQRLKKGSAISGAKFSKKAAAAPQGGGVVEVTLEMSTTDAGDAMGWVEVPNTMVKLKRDGRSNSWTGEVRLLEEPKDQSYRLVIREYELFLGGGSGHEQERSLRGAQIERRLVYADVLEI
ncbi:hypothetical protein [Desulforhopalus singaporensis]|uniref:Uncharacterized protein n=1 Tax=Desulforhopalus singaporensis TaxID=91360 RepID=A0A1H0URD1_9BACT|nr:hypothetical protein [Desulforhopalus singaporensis]SDP68653.1 hypothetical protein SAMN05660330_03681 [Desulforhopalus singaporensis]